MNVLYEIYIKMCLIYCANLLFTLFNFVQFIVFSSFYIKNERIMNIPIKNWKFFILVINTFSFTYK